MPAKRANAAKKRVPIDGDTIPRRKRRDGFVNNNQKRRPWEPTANQWAQYDAVRRGGSLRYVGEKFGISFQAVEKTCNRIDDYLSAMYIDRVKRLRVRHTQHLEHIFCEAIEAWGTSKKSADGKLPGEAVYLREAMRALAAIRKIHAVDKNPNADEHGDDTGERVAGKDREHVIQERINALNASLVASQVLRKDQGA